MSKLSIRREDGYYIISRGIKSLGWIAPNPFGRGWLVKLSGPGGVAFRTIAEARKYVHAILGR